jgi:hypothetical protein
VGFLFCFVFLLKALGRGGSEKGGIMRLLPAADFFALTRDGRPPKMDMREYEGHTFKCACGRRHVFYADQVKVVKGLSKMRLVVQCPDQSTYLTCVKASGLFWFKRLKSLCGARSEEDLDIRETPQNALEKKTSIQITEGPKPEERPEQVAHEYERMKRQLATELKETLQTGEELKILKGLSALDFDALMDLSKNPEDLSEQGRSVYSLFLRKIESYIGTSFGVTDPNN